MYRVQSLGIRGRRIRFLLLIGSMGCWCAVGLPSVGGQVIDEPSTPRYSIFPSQAPPTDPSDADSERTGDPRRAVETELFGLKARGSRFIYVLDRSASMSSLGGKPLRALKQQLARSLARLTAHEEFQMIFYNHRARLLQLEPGSPQMLWADDDQKKRAWQAIQVIHAEGGTDHLGALQLALGMAPDAVFFLTDADRPQLTMADLRQVERWNGGARIFAIELAAGPPPDGTAFLKRLAEQSGGRYAYVDILTWKE